MFHLLSSLVVRRLIRQNVCVVWALITPLLPLCAQSFARNMQTAKVQPSSTEQRITLKKALSDIESKFNVVFGYQSDMVLNRTVAAGEWLGEANAEAALVKVLGGSNIEFKKINANNYVLKERRIKNTEPEAIGSEVASNLPPNASAAPEAAENRVTGRVTDENSKPMPGVSILLKGTTNGTTTDGNGDFKISVPDASATLVFTFIGYVKQEILVGNKTNVNLQLVPDVGTLNEVVVVGYGTQKKKDLTGAVAQVKGEDLKNLPANDLGTALQGRVPGAFITTSSGEPGAGSQIVIRGPVSINGGDPFIVVDGLPFTGTGFNFNAQDIESIEILKDASAAAIYGAKAAAGVIIVTTKRGKAGSLKISANFNYGVRNVMQFPQTLRRDEYIKAKQAFGFDVVDLYGPQSGWSQLPDTDWFKEVYRQGKDQSYNVSLSGGNDRSTYFLSGNYTRLDGTRVSNGIERYTLRINSDHKISKRLKFSQILYTKMGVDDPNGTTNQGALSFRNTPVMKVYDPTNPIGGWGRAPRGFQGGHELQSSTGNFAQNKTYEINLAGTFDYQIIEGLNARATLGTGFGSYDNYFYNYLADIGTSISGNDFRKSMGKSQSYISTFTLNYDKAIGKHHFKALAGYEARKSDFSSMELSNRNALVEVPQSSDLVKDVNTAVSRSNQGNIYERILSQFARVEYAYADKYLLTVNVRRDGYATRFGPNNKIGVFPGVSAGWKISDEAFMKSIPFISFLKLRAGYGKLGNSPGFDFAFSGDYSQGFSADLSRNGGNRQSSIGLTTKLPNPNIQWEEVATVNVGIDGALLNNKLNFNLDYYVRETRKMIYPVGIPASAGSGSSVPFNIGQMTNNGFEFNLEWRDKMNNGLGYTVGLNGGFNRNKLISLDPSLERLQITSGGLVEIHQGQPNRSEPGYALGQFFGYVVDGIYQKDAATTEKRPFIASNDYVPRAGDLIYRDLNNDGKINEDDRAFIGNPWPKLTYGINLSANYKGFDVRLFFAGSYGNKIYNGYESMASTFFSDYTTTKAIFGTSGFNGNGVTDMPRVGTITDLDKNGNWGAISSYHVQNGSYLRMRNVQLGYNVSRTLATKMGMSSMRVFLMADNLFTITGYKGLNPEVPARDGSFLQLGLDNANQLYPMSRLVSMGVNLEF